MDYQPLFINGALLGFASAAVLYLLAFQNAPRRFPTAAAVSATKQPPTPPQDTSDNVSLGQKRIAQLAFGLFVAATGALTGAFINLVLHGSAGVQPSLSILTGLLLALVVSWLSIIGHVGYHLRLIGAFVAPLATLILLVQSFVSPAAMRAGADVNTAVLGGGLSAAGSLTQLMGLHVLMAVLGQAFAILACAISIFYLWQQTLLKKKLINQLPKSLPAIDKLDSLLTTCLWVGFVFITLSLLSGAIYTQMAVTAQELADAGYPSRLGLEFKVIWAIIIWLWYLATLLARNIFNRPGKRIAQMSLGGFLLLAMAYFGMVFFKA